MILKRGKKKQKRKEKLLFNLNLDGDFVLRDNSRRRTTPLDVSTFEYNFIFLPANLCGIYYYNYYYRRERVFSFLFCFFLSLSLSFRCAPPSNTF